MIDPIQPAPASTATPPGLLRLATWCAYASGGVAVFGIAFLIAFFTLGGVFGALNDIAVAVHYTLLMPIAVALYRILRPVGPGLSLAALVIGLAGMLAVVVLQLLLVAGVLPFSQQIVLVVPAFLDVLAWFVLNWSLGRGGEILPEGLLLTVLAGLYFGYPLWAFRVGERLRDLSES